MNRFFPQGRASARFLGARALAATIIPTLLVGAAPVALAGPFHITANSTTAQTLGGTDAGLVDAGKTLGPSGIGVKFTGSTDATHGPTLTNNGTIKSTGGRAVDTSFSAGNVSLTITNNAGATITSANADALRINADTGTGTVILTNAGTISETGTGGNNGQAVDFGNITSTNSNVTINNQAGGQITAADSDAIRLGAGNVLNNYGTISDSFAPTAAKPTGNSSGNDGVDLQANANATINNYAGGTITGARDGITGDNPAIIYNEGTITGTDGGGLNFDTTGTSVTKVTNMSTGTIVGNAVSAGSDADGIDIDGLINLDNYGTVKAVGVETSDINEALAIGGGTIVNETGGVIISDQRAITVDDSNLSNALGALNLTNKGTITGSDGEAIKITSTFTNTITNQGTINGSVVLGAGDDLVNLYTGSMMNGMLDGGLGNDTVHLTGAGTGTLTTFRNIETVDVDSGTWTALLDNADVGAVGAGYNTLSLKDLDIAAGAILGLGDGLGTGGEALYVRELDGALLSGGFVTNIFGNGFNIYYDPYATGNAYLGGLTYNLENGGQLIADAPEPESLALAAPAMGLLAFAFYRRSKNAAI